MKWVSVKDRLPETLVRVVVWGTSKCHCGNREGYYLAEYFADYDRWEYGEYSCRIEVTHWMIPEKPKNEE